MFKCRQCGRCCCPVILTAKMFERFKHLAQRKYKLIKLSNHDVLPDNDEETCIFFDPNNNCVIYKDRPKVCRIYGVHKELPCINQSPKNAKKKFKIKVKDIIKHIKSGEDYDRT